MEQRKQRERRGREERERETEREREIERERERGEREREREIEKREKFFETGKREICAFLSLFHNQLQTFFPVVGRSVSRDY